MEHTLYLKLQEILDRIDDLEVKIDSIVGDTEVDNDDLKEETDPKPQKNTKSEAELALEDEDDHDDEIEFDE